MRKAAVSSVVAGLMLLSASSGWSKGVLIAPGPRANAMGAAYVGLADDLYAIYFNPAGLAQMKDKHGAEVSVFMVSGKSTGSNSLSNNAVVSSTLGNNEFPLPNVNAVISALPGYAALRTAEPGTFKSKEFKTDATIPFLAGYTKVNDITIALGVYGSGGGGGKWEDTDATMSGKVDGSYSFVIANISAAKTIGSKLMVGVGCDYVMMEDKLKYSKGFVTPVALSYTIAGDRSATGAAMQFNAGALYKFNDQWQAGAVYRSGADIKLTGKMTMSQTGLGASVLGPVYGYPASYESNYERQYKYPTTYGVGLTWKPTEKWVVGTGYDQSVYSGMRNKYTYDTQLPGLISNTDFSEEWRDISQLRLGAEYKCNEALALRAGLQTDERLAKNEKRLSILDLNEYDMTYASLGAGYAIKSWVIDLTYARGMSNKPSLGTTEFEYSIDIVRFGAQYKF